jgi:4-amino-4-deoxy-L-arabinose transferase-like glycosyltransferase
MVACCKYPAITLVLVFLIGRILTGSRIAALVGPFVLGLAGIFWSQAVIAEIYTPAAMLLAGVLLCLFIWRQGDNPRYLFLAGLLGGLSLGVHNTVSLAAPAIFVYLLLTTRRRTDWLNAIAGSGLGIALFLAAFFWIDSRLVPTSYFDTVVRTSLSGWGLSPQDLNTPLKRLSFLFGARQFRGQMFGAPLGVIGLNIQRYWHALRADFSIFALGLIALGVLSPFTRKRQVMDWREALLILLCLLFILGFVFNYHIGDIHVFYIPSYVILGIVCSLGAALFLDLLAWPSRQDSLGGTKWSLFFASIYGLLILFLVVWPMRDVTYQSWQAGHLLTTRHRNRLHRLGQPLCLLLCYSLGG